MSLILHFIYSFFATVGFAVVFNTPKKSLIYGGLCGSTGWTVYTALQPLISPAPANLIAAISVAALGELFARINKNPVTAFVIPGIIPLVPGYGIYPAFPKFITRVAQPLTSQIEYFAYQ